MGEYLNPNNALFARSLNSEIYVDKSMLIEKTNRRLFTENQYLCVSRPRRFGKSITLSMLAAYYSRGCDSREMFSQLKIASSPDFEKHLNQYNVIRIYATDFIKKNRSIQDSLAVLQKYLVRDLKREFANADVLDWDDIPLVLQDIYAETKIPFVFLVDEWDCAFRERQSDLEGRDIYLHFLRDLLKDKDYVALVYMTGILPIKKYGEHSALNMFTEYSMTNQRELAEYTGFTEKEVTALCEQYGMDISETKRWYDGYDVNGIDIYNPRSVVQAMTGRIYDSYWTQTETYEALKKYILFNLDGLKDKITKLIAGDSIPVNTKKFQNDMVTINSADDVLTLLIHLGYLTYHFDDRTVSIPNSEVEQEFINAIEDGGWETLMDEITESKKLLADTIAGNEKRVAQQLDKIHSENTSLFSYNNENSLACVLTIAYFAAKNDYILIREPQAGKGRADIVFMPSRIPNAPAMVIELKWNKSADTALSQIKAKQYADCLKDYKGTILLVGINYDPKDKKHTCKIEKIEK